MAPGSSRATGLVPTARTSLGAYLASRPTLGLALSSYAVYCYGSRPGLPFGGAGGPERTP